jgi:ABC-2 type transport system permease protein
VRRWLKIVRAELLRDVQQALRYPLDLLSGIAIMYVFFLGLFTGAQSIAGPAGSFGAQNLGGLVIGFSLWFLALFAINAVTVDIESEARQGTLEQVFVSVRSFVALLWVRGIVHVVLGAAAVATLALLIQLTTGHWLNLGAANLLPALWALVLTVLQVLGLGLILGGLSLVFKRIGQVAAIVQFGLFFLATVDVSALETPWRTLVLHAPVAGGATVLRLLNGGQYDSALYALGGLALDTLLYAGIGTLVFVGLQRVALRAGSLSHY